MTFYLPRAYQSITRQEAHQRVVGLSVRASAKTVPKNQRHSDCRGRSHGRNRGGVGGIAMFLLLGKLVARAWLPCLAGWLLLLFTMRLIAPPWDEVAESGQFSFLPKDVPSNRGKDLFKAAFPKEVMGSNIVLVLSRQDEIPIYEDKDLVDYDLKAGLLQIGDEEGGLAADQRGRSVIARIQTFNDEGKGALLVNGYQNAGLVVIDLTVEFLERSAWPPVHAVESLIERLHRETKVPEGLEIAMPGSAVVGRDMRGADQQTTNRIETWTIWLIIGLLLVIYRAPLLALIPLATVFFAVQIAIDLLVLLAKNHLLTLSETNRIYITVLAYGAGVDYCLFLIARYREELQQEDNLGEALATAICKGVGTIAPRATNSR